MKPWRHGLVTLSGLPGSGTTTAARLVSQATGFRWVNTGKVFREMALKRGLSVNDFGKLAGMDPTIDLELDRKQISIAKTGRVVLEGRLAGFMATREGLDRLTVWLEAPIETRAARIAARENLLQEEALRLTQEREQDERSRYLACYGFDLEDLSIYDLVIDSVIYSPQDICNQILAALSQE